MSEITSADEFAYPPGTSIVDMRGQGAIDIRNSMSESDIVLTGDVGVLVFGKDVERSKLVADVIATKLYDTGLPVARHEFHAVGKSHRVEVDTPSVLDALTRRDPKLFGTAVVVAHDNIGMRLVGMETQAPALLPQPAKAPFSQLSLADQAHIQQIGDEQHNQISQAMTDNLIDGIVQLAPSVAPVNFLASVKEYILHLDPSEAAYDGYNRVRNFVMAIDQAERNLLAGSNNAGHLMHPAFIEREVSNIFEKKCNERFRNDLDKEMDEHVERELLDMAVSYLSAKQATRNGNQLYLEGELVRREIEGKAGQLESSMCEHLTEILAATAQRVAQEYPVAERFEVARKFIDSVEIETMGDDIRDRALNTIRTDAQSPAMINGKRVIHQFANNREEITRLLEDSVMDPEVRERVITAYVGDSRPPISGAYVRKPGQAFNEGLQKLQELADLIGEQAKPTERTDGLQQMDALVKQLETEAQRVADGVYRQEQDERMEAMAERAAAVETTAREEADATVARVRQLIADDDQLVIEHLEDMLQDASEMRVGDTEEENGIKRSNTKKGPVLVLPTGIKVHRY